MMPWRDLDIDALLTARQLRPAEPSRDRALRASELPSPRDSGRGTSARVRRASVPKAPSRPGTWTLVQVWDGAVLARFADEASAREAMTGVDDDEVVVLCIRS